MTTVEETKASMAETIRDSLRGYVGQPNCEMTQERALDAAIVLLEKLRKERVSGALIHAYIDPASDKVGVACAMPTEGWDLESFLGLELIERDGQQYVQTASGDPEAQIIVKAEAQVDGTTLFQIVPYRSIVKYLKERES